MDAGDADAKIAQQRERPRDGVHALERQQAELYLYFIRRRFLYGEIRPARSDLPVVDRGIHERPQGRRRRRAAAARCRAARGGQQQEQET